MDYTALEETYNRDTLHVIGRQVHDGVELNVIGPRTRGPYSGSPVRRPPRMVGRRFARYTWHLLGWFPMTPFEIRLEDIGALVRQWDVVDPCLTCDGVGSIQKEHPNHLWAWARVLGEKCRRCNGHGRIVHQYEEQVQLPRSFIRRTQLLFRAADGGFHLTTKKGRVRKTRCGEFKELPEMLLTAYGQSTCLMCLAWMP